MKAYVHAEGSTPLLIFPEGTCVNNEYVVMFKRGAFDLDATVCPVAIKYNKIFVDAFWNSRRQSFTQHIVRIRNPRNQPRLNIFVQLRLITPRAVVCDVYFSVPEKRSKLCRDSTKRSKTS